MPVSEIRQCVTRPFRLDHYFTSAKASGYGPTSDQTTLHLNIAKVFSLSFDVGPLFKKASRPRIRLAPGGRWAVGLANAGEELRLYCWDLMAAGAHSNSSTLAPVAMIESSKPVLRRDYRDFEMQYDEAEQCINIMLSYTSALDTYV